MSPLARGHQPRCAPLGEVGPLRAESGVLPVSGVEPCVVGELVEHPALQVVYQAVKSSGVTLSVQDRRGTANHR